jgi:hypothetical protein
VVSILLGRLMCKHHTRGVVDQSERMRQTPEIMLHGEVFEGGFSKPSLGLGLAGLQFGSFVSAFIAQRAPQKGALRLLWASRHRGHVAKRSSNSW